MLTCHQSGTMESHEMRTYRAGQYSTRGAQEDNMKERRKRRAQGEQAFDSFVPD